MKTIWIIKNLLKKTLADQKLVILANMKTEY